LHALHMVSPNSLRDLDKEWLDNLLPIPPTASDADNPYHWIRIRDKPNYPELDAFVQIKLPWMLVATVDAYPSGTVLQRVTALQWLESALQQPTVVNADTQPNNWWRAELLYGLKYVLQSTPGPGLSAD
jgi:hypothetical protein